MPLPMLRRAPPLPPECATGFPPRSQQLQRFVTGRVGLNFLDVLRNNTRMLASVLSAIDGRYGEFFRPDQGALPNPGPNSAAG